MLQYIIKKLGLPKARVVPSQWETLIPGLKAKRWDIIFSGMTVTEERRQGAGIEFSRPYYFESDRIVVKKDLPYQKPEDLAGKTIGVPIGTVEEIQGKALVAKGIGGELKAFNDIPGVFLALNSGQVDAVIMDNTIDRRPDGSDARICGLSAGSTISPPIPNGRTPRQGAYKYGGDGAGVRKEDTASPGRVTMLSMPWMPMERARRSSRNTVFGTVAFTKEAMMTNSRRTDRGCSRRSGHGRHGGGRGARFRKGIAASCCISSSEFVPDYLVYLLEGAVVTLELCSAAWRWPSSSASSRAIPTIAGGRVMPRLRAHLCQHLPRRTAHRDPALHLLHVARSGLAPSCFRGRGCWVSASISAPISARSFVPRSWRSTAGRCMPASPLACGAAMIYRKDHPASGRHHRRAHRRRLFHLAAEGLRPGLLHLGRRAAASRQLHHLGRPSAAWRPICWSAPSIML